MPNSHQTCHHAVTTRMNYTITLSQREGKEMMYTAFDTTLVVGIMPFLVVVGLVTNLSFLFVVVRVPYMRTVTNYYLCLLTIADIALLVTAVGEKLWYFAASPIKMDESVFGAAGCVWTYVLKKTFYWASMFLVTLVNLEKFCAVCWPLKYRIAQGKSKWRMLKRILGVWVAGVLLSFLGLLSNGRYTSLRIGWLHESADEETFYKIGVCCPLNSTLDWVVLVVYAIVFLALLFANSLMSVGIIKALRCRVEMAPVHQASVTARRIEINRQISRMLIVNCVVFYLLLIPRHCYDIAGVVQLNALPRHQRHVVLNITRILLYLNSVINPVIYFAVNARYRKALKRAFSSRTRNVRDIILLAYR